MRHNIALVMGFLSGIINLYTLLRQVADLIARWQNTSLEPVRNPIIWFTLSRKLFISTGLVVFYGLMSLWLINLKIITWTGCCLVVVTGLVYLLAEVTYIQTQSVSPAIPQGRSMVMLSLAISMLKGKLFMRSKHI